LAACRLGFNGQLSSLEPEVCFRGVKNYKGIVDAGVRAGFLNDQANLYGIYHNSGNFSAGAGYTIKSTVSILALYTSQTKGLKTYFGGTYQLGLKIRLFRNKPSHFLD
jgi:hypothetical protein